MNNRPNANSAHGLSVELPTVCPTCSAVLATIGEGREPHKASLRCTSCNAFRGHMSIVTWSFIANLAGRFGAPTEPIKIRRSSYEPAP
jgi:hypothetical protein